MSYGYRKHKRIVPEVGPRPLTGLVGDASCLPVRDSVQRHGFFHGPVEWQVVDIATGKKVFCSPVYQFGNVNIAELLAILDATSLLHQVDDHETPVYSDSLTAIAWYRHKKIKSTYPRNEQTERLYDLLSDMMKWVIKERPTNPVLFWDNVKWRENPADYGRK